MNAGLSFIVNAWTPDQVDPATGWPTTTSPFQSHTFNVVEGGITLNYTFPLNDVPDSGVDLRVTAQAVGSEPQWDNALPAIVPADPTAVLAFSPGDWMSDVDFTIAIGEDDTGTR